MRHRKSGRKLNRNSSHRKAMFANMAVSLINEQVIRTTLPKAKELRGVVEPLITIAKKGDTVASRRLVAAKLKSNSKANFKLNTETQSKASDKAKAVRCLFDELAPRYKDRQGGYVRVLKCGFRTGDKAPMAYVELVDREGFESQKASASQTTETPKAAEEN